MEEEEQHENIIMIRGFPVSFPKGRKPFAPQLALMSKLLMGVQKRENCLLESPTGTGKTLALLCAALAWQRQQRELNLAAESDREVEVDEGADAVSGAGSQDSIKSFDDFRYVEPKRESPVELAYEADATVQSSNGEGASSEGAARAESYDEYDDDAFESPKKKRQKNPITRARQPHRMDDDVVSATGSGGVEAGVAATAAARAVSSAALSPSGCASEAPDLKPTADCKPSSVSGTPRAKTSGRRPRSIHRSSTRKRAPLVYFCSRTHSQLNQVVAELRTCRTTFQDTSAVGIDDDGKPFSMALLASRTSTCINKQACSDPKGIDDACKRLLKEKACTYYRNAKRGQTKLPPVWDVEEAVHLGKAKGACPYYTARASLVTADLILCPYNYIVDPVVRETMGINLKDAVVIFDEAHNLEDSAREAASVRLSLRALSNAAGEMQRLGANSPSLGPSYDLLLEVIVGVQAFLEEEDVGLNLDSYEQAHKVFHGTEALGLMQSRAGVTPASLVLLKEALKRVINEDGNPDPYAVDQDDGEGSSQGSRGDVLSSGSVHVTASLVKVLGFLLAKDMGNAEHYKMVVLRERGPWEPTISRGRRGGRNRRGSGPIMSMETYLCFWCLSASTCFSEIDKQVHSIVLTSGTLSPLDSFAGELGVEFPHRLEAPHVINVRKQCLVTSIGYFGGVSLDARYTNQHDLKYQDALGTALLEHARVVPGGILAFFPSYGLMEKMHDRWKMTGLLQALGQIKGIHLEPRGQGKIDGVLADYYEDIREAREVDENNPSSPRTGALMLAVARGKVSEGIDFSDDAARMCIVVGIPYPSAKDLQVVLKKEYQDKQRTRNPRLVGGRAWYNLQAFRAVNQAVGRCIRHRNDFGAIVLCDPRYGSSKETTASLSKWVRSSVKQCRKVEASLPQVAAFFRQHHQLSDERRAVAPACAGQPVSSSCASSQGSGAEGLDFDASCGRPGASQGGGCGTAAAQESPESGPAPDVISQIFGKNSAERTPMTVPVQVPKSKPDTVDERVPTVAQGAHGRTALQILSQGAGGGTRQTSICDNTKMAPEALASLVPRRQDGTLRCHRGGLLAMRPAGAHAHDDLRRVFVRANCHLYRATASLSSRCGEARAPAREENANDLGDRATLVEVPRGWALGGGVSEGEGRWVAGDGVVYAPLCCSCYGCDSARVGEKAVGAGLHGQDLIGRAWFFSSRVQADDGVFNESTPKELLLPTKASPTRTAAFTPPPLSEPGEV